MISIILSGVTQAQTEATAKLDTNSILVGDQTGLEITFTCPADYKVIWPSFTDTITGDIEIVKKTPTDSTRHDDGYDKLFVQRLIITAFDSGYFAIPPVSIKYKTPDNNEVQTAETGALLLEVKTVPVNLEENIKDIKPPIEAPFTLREALPYILVFSAVALLTFLVIFFIRKRKKAEPIFKAPPKPALPPHRQALDDLESLRYKKLWQNGHIKEYHTELTDIVRDYLDAQFGIDAPEYTSDEIMEAVNKTSANPTAKQKLQQTLTLADLVKFAKMEPLPLEHDASLNNAIDFVKETMHLNPTTEPAEAPLPQAVVPKVEETPLSEDEKESDSGSSENKGKEAGDV
ncbi:MAG: hypothetical protein KDC05_04015 [Bacteroidales bacterium]|nr:hypothetical protein [Bacteroidales bacterium]